LGNSSYSPTPLFVRQRLTLGEAGVAQNFIRRNDRRHLFFFKKKERKKRRERKRDRLIFHFPFPFLFYYFSIFFIFLGFLLLRQRASLTSIYTVFT
jgi:hypothetical protein